MTLFSGRYFIYYRIDQFDKISIVYSGLNFSHEYDTLESRYGALLINLSVYSRRLK